ncbi:MAG: SIMPL domain-containing protein [Dehalococcoidia bacterium]
MIRSLRYVPFVALALVGTLFALPRSVSAQEPEPPQLTVQGQGVVTARPDVAIITMGAVVRRDTAEQAFTDANTAAGSLTQFLRSQGIAERDITTRQFSLSPEFTRGEGDAEPRLVAWRGTNILSVKVRDFSTIGAVIDGAVQILGSDAQISGITFTIENTDAVAGQAREQAVAEARARAEQLAAAAGVRLIRILSITETSAPLPRPVAADVAAAPVARAVAEVAPGEQTITVSVEVVYEIG